MNKKILPGVCISLALLFGAGCSTQNNDGSGRTANNIPLPHVRIEAMPGVTVIPGQTVEPAAPSPEATATAPVYYEFYVEPTPDEDAIAAEIQSLIDDITRKLQSENFVLTP